MGKNAYNSKISWKLSNCLSNFSTVEGGELGRRGELGREIVVLLFLIFLGRYDFTWEEIDLVDKGNDWSSSKKQSKPIYDRLAWLWAKNAFSLFSIF